MLFYRPYPAVAGDVIPFYDEGVYKPFYLRNFRSHRDREHQDGWVMLSTKDHLHFEETDTHIVGGTGSVLKVDGVYHMFYCIFRQSPEQNLICHATSEDLDTWTTLEAETFPSDNQIYGFCHWRDPFVFWNEEEQCWWILMAATKRGPSGRQACVGLCKSEDLHHWRYCEPLYAPMNAAGAFECPDLFKWGDWWYLVFSCYTDRFCTMYRMARSLEGPWIKPAIDTFDTRCFYAAKTVWDGHRRVIYGWNPTREANEHGFDPKDYAGKDANTWDWGGNLIVDELWQRADGTLGIKPLPEVVQAVAQMKETAMVPLTGDWRQEGAEVCVSVPYAYGAALLGRLPSTCRVEMDVCFTEGVRRFGIALQVDETFAKGYYIELEPAMQRVQYKSPIRMTESWGQRFSYEVEMERPLPMQAGNVLHVTLLMEDDILECYFGGDTAMGTRMSDLHGRCLGLFAEQGEVTFSNIALYTL